MATATKAVSTEFDPGFGTTRWTNPSNAFATTGDNVYATAAPAKNGEIDSAFGVAFTTSDIPDGSTITAVTWTVEWKLSALVTGGGLLIKPKGGLDQTNKTTTVEEQSTVSHVNTALPTLANLRTAASASTDPFYVIAGCFKGNTNSALTGSIDFISCTVTFTAPQPLPILVTAVGTGSSV